MTLTLEAVEPFGLFDTIITFTGRDEDGVLHRFGVDHRPARDLRYVLEARDCAASYEDRADFHAANPGVDDELLDEPFYVDVEDWQLLGVITEDAGEVSPM